MFIFNWFLVASFSKAHPVCLLVIALGKERIEGIYYSTELGTEADILYVTYLNKIELLITASSVNEFLIEQKEENI